MVGVAPQGEHAAILDPSHDAASIRAVAVAGGVQDLRHGTSSQAPQAAYARQAARGARGRPSRAGVAARTRRRSLHETAAPPVRFKIACAVGGVAVEFAALRTLVARTCARTRSGRIPPLLLAPPSISPRRSGADLAELAFHRRSPCPRPIPCSRRSRPTSCTPARRASASETQWCIPCSRPPTI